MFAHLDMVFIKVCTSNLLANTQNGQVGQSDSLKFNTLFTEGLSPTGDKQPKKRWTCCTLPTGNNQTKKGWTWYTFKEVYSPAQKL